jgi:hypothetical protein
MTRFNDNYYDRIITATELLNKNRIKYIEHQNGKITVKKLSYYSITDTWIDTLNRTRGRGIETFIKYVKLKEVLK